MTDFIDEVLATGPNIREVSLCVECKRLRQTNAALTDRNEILVAAGVSALAALNELMDVVASDPGHSISINVMISAELARRIMVTALYPEAK